MTILILSPFFPYPLSQGGKIRVFNIIKHLSRMGHRITLACLSEAPVSDYGPLAQWCEEIICTERRPNLARDLSLFLLGSEPFNSVRYSSSRFREALGQLLKKRSFDLAQIEFSLVWQYADLFRGMPIVLDAHNIEHENIRQIRDGCRNPLKKLLYELEARKLRRAEERAWRECSLCFAVSDGEKEIIELTSGIGKVFTASNGVDIERFSFLPKAEAGLELLFIGGLEYLPNLDAAKFLLAEVLPAIRSKTPGARLSIVGRELSKLAVESSSKGIELHENAPDILPHFRKADVLIVPLRYGAGTRIKILEAMAAGVPVVTTSKGCEGIDARHGEHLMIADSPADFAVAVERLSKNSALRAAVVHNARKLVEENYSWEKIAGEMEKAYRAGGISVQASRSTGE